MATAGSYSPDISSEIVDAVVSFRFTLTDTASITPADIKVNIDGDDYTVANDGLEVNKWTKYSGGSIVTDDLNAYVDVLVYDRSSTELSTATVKVYYPSTTLLDTVTVNTSWRDIGTQASNASLMPMPSTAFGQLGGPKVFFILNNGYVWTDRLVEFTVLEHKKWAQAEAYFYLGHDVFVEYSGEILVGTIELSDVPGEMLVRGYVRNNTPGEMLVQGYFVTDTSGEILIGIDTLKDLNVGEILVAVTELVDVPGELMVYKVNRDTVLDVFIIDSDTITAFAKAGITIVNEV